MVRRALLIGSLVAAAAALSACGFTPLYATGGTAGGLSVIDVQTPSGDIQAPDGRAAYLLREQLNDALARDASKPAVYRLTISKLSETRDPRGLGSTNVASRYELSMRVEYALTEIAGGRELTHGGQTVLVSYPAVTPPYAGVVAQQDSQQRAATEAARRIRLDLAEYFLKTKH
ncbi:MAG: LPS assembly lipoprotein LptE [Alphaproteobacteria bacterium]